MRILSLLLIMLLTACTVLVPVKQKFPEPPALQALVPCPQLQKLEPGALLSDVAKTVTVNYTEYYVCAIKTDAWQEWYQKQEFIFESVNK
jgi:hypothetical protein